MLFIDNAQVRALLRPADAIAAIEQAFAAFATGDAAVQERRRTAVGQTKLSTMGAVLKEQGVAGAKVYTTINGAFRFVVLLFDAESGAPLACIEADAFTELRTACVTAIVARLGLTETAREALVFGTGVQARSHIKLLSADPRLERFQVVSRGDASGFCEDLSRETGRQVVSCDAVEDALGTADLIVTTTRTATPVVHGAALKPGTFVAAIGSTLPSHAEVDTDTVRRAASIVVEWQPQTLAEAGDLVRADSEGALDKSRIVELGDIVAGKSRARRAPDEVVLFESVGIGLEDVAVAAAVYHAARQTGR